MPMKSFLTSTSPSFGVGTGRSVLYSNTSIPPVFSIKTPFIVLGIEVAIVRANEVALNEEGESCECSCVNREELRRLCVRRRVVSLADMQESIEVSKELK